MDAKFRQDLDRFGVEAGRADQPMLICCARHPEAGCNPHYKLGELRLLCTVCGFEVDKIKVADR